MRINQSAHVRSLVEAYVGEPELRAQTVTFTGTLKAEEGDNGPWAFLQVDKGIPSSAFQALQYNGVPCEPRYDNPHVTVVRASEVEELQKVYGRDGWKDAILTGGDQFEFWLKDMVDVDPIGWDAMDRVWFIRIESPELQRRRMSLGLTPLPTADNGMELEFHITVAGRPKPGKVEESRKLVLRALFEDYSIAERIGDKPYPWKPTGEVTKNQYGLLVFPDYLFSTPVGEFKLIVKRDGWYATSPLDYEIHFGPEDFVFGDADEEASGLATLRIFHTVYRIVHDEIIPALLEDGFKWKLFGIGDNPRKSRIYKGWADKLAAEFGIQSISNDSMILDFEEKETEHDDDDWLDKDADWEVYDKAHSDECEYANVSESILFEEPETAAVMEPKVDWEQFSKDFEDFLAQFGAKAERAYAYVPPDDVDAEDEDEDEDDEEIEETLTESRRTQIRRMFFS